MDLIKNYTSKIKKAMLYQAWISPEMVIPPITRIESNPVIGGAYKLYSQSPNGVGIMQGVFQKLLDNEILAYSWHWEGTNEQTLVTVTFKENSDGTETTIIIEHRGFQSEDFLRISTTNQIVSCFDIMLII